MSTKLKLWIYRHPISELAEMDVQGVRILCAVLFKTDGGYTEARWAIIDTGSALSIIPQSIWKRCSIQTHKDYEIRGLVPKEECSQLVCFGEITCRLFDEHHITDPIVMKADLAYTDDVPIILGFKDLLEEIPIHIACKKDIAYLEFDKSIC